MADDDIVIVGIGCKFPGADNLDEFWRVLANGENHVKEIPKERWNVDAYYDPDPNAGAGKTYVRKAGFINRVNDWDHRFYGINDIEAKHIDPQQKVVLDCVHMALEDGGITRKDIDGTHTGVYIGSMNDDYKQQLMEDNTSPYIVSGMHNSIISARVAYVYNLFGPAMTIDTACSSSLVAIHSASQALALGDIDVAICGGVNVMLDPVVFFSLSAARMLSPTGQCQAFSADADGYVRSEGCGIVILKKLKQALKDGNKIWGIIKTGSNQDGHMMTPITAPSGKQQGQLLERLYRKHNVNKDHMQVIEAHGTGTPVGDPIESNALGTFFRSSGRITTPDTIYIGSVKTNIGHTEAAAGVAGLIKVLLMMKNKQIAPSLMYQKSNENPKIQFHKYGIEVVTKMQSWADKNDQGRLACVNSFGFGGTNSHAIVKEYVPKHNRIEKDNMNYSPYLIAITAPNNESLQANVRTFVSHLKDKPYDMRSLSFTSTCKRDLRLSRKCFAVENQQDLVGLCESYMSSKKEKTSTSNITGKPKIVFVFCGVGTTWNGMCQDMFKFDVFDKAIHEIDKRLQPLTGWYIREKLMEGNEVVANPLIAHIAIFACQVGILALMRDFGIIPDVVLGQSVGEVAAAYASGSIDICSAVQIIYHRSMHLSKTLKGGMAVVKGIPWQWVDDFCKLSEKVINIAVFNSPISCTVSGDHDEIDRLKIELMRDNAKGGVVIDLDVHCAYHSPYVTQAADNLKSSLESISSGNVSIPIISTVTGKQEPYELFLQQNYWKENTQSPVKFQHAIKKAVVSTDTEGTVFVEIGPSPVLRGHLQNILNDDNKFIALPTMTKQTEFKHSLAKTICVLFEYGFKLNWNEIVPFTAVTTDIPKYAFTKHKAEYKIVTLKHQAMVAHEPAKIHTFCRPILSEIGIQEIEATVNEMTVPFVFQHKVKGAILIPGAFYAEIGFEIGKLNMDVQRKESSVYLEFVKPVKVDHGKTSLLTTESSFVNKRCIRFYVKHMETVVCKGKVTQNENKMPGTYIDMLETKASLQTNAHRQLNSDQMYESLLKMGFEHGKCFQVMQRCITNGKCSFVELEIPDEVMTQVDATTLHPCILDGMLQSVVSLTDDKSFRLIQDENLIMMPVAIESIRVFKKATKRMSVITKVSNVFILNSVLKLHYNLQLLDLNGTLLAEVTNYMSYSRRHSNITPDELKYRLSWKMLARSQPIETSPNVIVIDITNESPCPKLLKKENWVVCKYSSQHHKEVKNFISTHVTRFANERWGSIGKADAIVLLFGKEINTTITIADVNTIYQRSKQNCMFVVAILKALMDVQFKIPLFITTQNTKQVHGVSEKVPINLIGNDIWGLVRNVQMEFAHTKMTLVDLIPSIEETSNALDQYINANHASIERSHTEIAICRDNIYCSEIIKTDMAEITPTYRKQICFPEAVPHGIYSESQYFVLSPFLKPHHKQTQTMLKGKGYIDILLSSVYVHTSTLFRISTTQSVNHVEEQSDGGHLVLGLEYSGLPVRPSKKSIFCCGDSSSVDSLENLWGVVAVFPQNLTTVATVPLQCCVKIRDLPFYEPGMLAKSVMYLTMLQYVPKKSKVICITNEKDMITTKLLQTFLETHTSSHIVTDNQTADVVLVTSTITDKNHDSIVKAKHVIYVKDTIDIRLLDMLLRLKNGKQEDCIAVNPCDVYAENNVAKYLKIAVRTLQKSHRCGIITIENKIEDNDENKHAVDTSIRVRTVDGDLTLPVKTKLENLFAPSDIVVLTGGLTGLGWQIILLLAEIGVGTIATLSRRILSEEQKQEVVEIKNRFDCNVECFQGDVTDISSLQNAISNVKNKYKQGFIRGVIHCAGVLDAKFALDLDEESLEKVMNPKVLGAMNIHIVTRSLKLDFFIMHSSISSFIGRPGQGSYGAANAFMDAFAQWRRQKGLPAQTINWGALAVGMAAREEFAANFVKRGYLLLPIPEIRSCFLQAIMENRTEVIYSNIDWALFVNNFSTPDMLRTKLMFDTVLKQKNIKAKESDVVDVLNEYNQDQLQACDRVTQISAITKLVEYVVRRVAGAEIYEIKTSSTLSELGIDSMAAVTFVNIVYDITDFRMMQPYLMDTDRTVNEIVTLLVESIFGTAKGETMGNSDVLISVHF